MPSERRCRRGLFVVAPPSSLGSAVFSWPPSRVAGEVIARLVGEADLASGECFAVCIVDSHGVLVALQRMDGGAPRWVRHCERKAYSAATMGRSTLDLATELTRRGRTIAEYGDPMMTSLPGGVPVLAGRTVSLAAVGVAGNGGADRDHRLATFGAELLSRQLGDISASAGNPPQ